MKVINDEQLERNFTTQKWHVVREDGEGQEHSRRAHGHYFIKDKGEHRYFYEGDWFKIEFPATVQYRGGLLTTDGKIEFVDHVGIYTVYSTPKGRVAGYFDIIDQEFKRF